MLSGFNTNLRHRGVLFHVQTEASGRANPHIISHLFHGGNILASRKSDYGNIPELTDQPDAVRDMMEAQHKAMLRSLIRGQCDVQILERLGPDAFGDMTADTEACIEAAEAELEEIHAESIEAELEEIPAQPTMASPPVDDSKERIARAFGDGVVSQRALDEVVLDYLVESARKRKRPSS